MKYSGTDGVRAKLGYWKYLKELRELARKNRNNPTEAEKIVWEILRRRFYQYKFTRQKPIDRFIVDFYCSKLLLAVEVDGEIHKKSFEKDKGRNNILEAMGILTVRFKNDEVLKNANLFIDKMREVVTKRSNEVLVLPFIKGRTFKEKGLV
jgi:leucyl-tRNA synthetase